MFVQAWLMLTKIGSFDVFSVAHSGTDVFLFALTIEFWHGVSGCGG